jgi:hypothetical protein
MDKPTFEVCIFDWRGIDGNWAMDPKPWDIWQLGRPVVLAYRFKTDLYTKTKTFTNEIWFRYDSDYYTWYRILCAPWAEHPLPNIAAELQHWAYQ